MHQKILAIILAGAMMLCFAIPAASAMKLPEDPVIETITEESSPSLEEIFPGEVPEDHPEAEETFPDDVPETNPDIEEAFPGDIPEDNPETDPSNNLQADQIEELPPAEDMTQSESEEAPEYTDLQVRYSNLIIRMEGAWEESWTDAADQPTPYVVTRRHCAWRGCSNTVVYAKTSYLCNNHKCSVSGCYRPRYSSTASTKCATHAGRPQRCQAVQDDGTICGDEPELGSAMCFWHMCPGCRGPGSDAHSRICSYCEQCWVLGCPNLSTCTNECDEHCPHSCKVHHVNHCTSCHGAGNCCDCNTCSHICKTHHEDHCLTCHGAGNCCDCNTCSHICKEHHLDHCAVCHTDPCVCYPADPVIQVGAWDSSDNSVTISISSDRATEIEIYTEGGTKVDTIPSASGSYTFYYDAVHHNGEYYVRVKNDAGYNSGNFAFTVSGLDREAPDAHSVTVSPSGWTQEKIITATANDQTNVLLALRYADGSPVPGTSEQESPASWTIAEQIESPKTFKLVSKDKWGYTSSFSFTVDKIDTVNPTCPTITKSPSVAWHNAAVTVKLSDSTAASGIDHYEYRIDNGNWQSGDSVTVSTQGVHKVEARAVSGVGLVSDIESSTIQIDMTKPFGSYTLSHQPGTWTTSAVTIQFMPTDAGGSGVKSVTLPNGSSASNLNNISYTASQNGSYEFIVTDNAGNVGKVVVKVDNIAMLDVTVTLSSPFIISPDDDKVYGGEVHFENRSNVPVNLTVTSLAPVGDAPTVVANDSRDWKALSVSQTKKNIAIGYVGNGKDVWITGTGEHAFGTVQKGGNAVYTMKARYGYAWDKPQSLSYAMTVKISVDQ